MTEITTAPLRGDILTPDCAVRVVGRLHPLRGERVHDLVPAGLSIAEILERVLPDGPLSPLASDFLVQIDGLPVPSDWWHRIRVKPGKTVTFGPHVGDDGALRAVLSVAIAVAAIVLAVPTGGASLALAAAISVSAATAGALIGLAVVVGGTLALNALLPVRPPSAPGGGEPFQQLNSIQGANNQSAPFGPIPFSLGVHRQSPFFGAKPYTEIIGDDQFIRLLFVWGYGPMQIDIPPPSAPSITSLRIGETPLSNYLDYQIEHRQGFPGDSPITLYPSQVDEQVLAITLNDSQDAAGLSGLQNADQDYQVQLTPVDIDQISIDVTAPEGIYQIDTGTGNAGGLAISVQARYRLVGTSTWTFFPPGSAPVGPTLTFFRSIKTARRGVLVTVARGQYEVAVRRITGHYNLDTVKEKLVWTALRSFKNTNPVAFTKPLAMTALRIRASDQLSGVIDTFNGICGSLVTAYSGAGGIWTVNTLSQNPADLFRWTLQAAANARPVADAQIDLVNLQDWWTYCVANGFKFNQVRSARTSVYDCLADIAAAGRAVPTFIDGKWGVVWDRPNDPIVQHFTPRNSWGFTGTRPYARLPHGWRVKFINEANGYTADERIVFDDGWDATSATLFEALEFPGVTHPNLIWKHGRFHIAQSRLRPEEVALSIGWENLICTRGDRVRVTHDVLLIGQIAGRVKSVAGQIVTLDEIVMIDVAKTWGLRFRIADPANTSFVRAVDLTGVVSGETRQVTLTGDLSAVTVGTLFAFGETNQESAVYRVKTVTHQKDLIAQLILVDDAPAISTADSGAIPAYNPHVTIPPDPFTLPPQNLKYQEVIDGFGAAVRALVRLTWQVPRFGKITSFEVQEIDHTGGGNWTRVDTVPAPLTTCDAPIISAGIWGFRVRCLFDDNTVSAWSTLDPLTLQGLLIAPADVKNFRWAFVSGRSELDWDPIADNRGPLYEMRKGASWDASLVVADALAQPRFQTIGDDTYWVAAYVVTPFGMRIYSLAKESLSITGTVLIDNVVVAHDERAEMWPGIRSGFVGIDQQQNYLRTGGTTNILSVTNVLTLADVLNGGGQGDGLYLSKWIVNAGRIARCRISIDFEATGVPANADFLGTPSILDDPDILQSYLTQFIRVYPVLRTAQTGPGDAFSEADIFAPSDVFTSGVTWSALTKWSPDVYQAWLFQVGLKFEILDVSVGAIAYALKFKWTIDVPDRFDRYQSLTVPVGGLAITFAPDGAVAPTAFTGGPSNEALPHITAYILDPPGARKIVIRNLTLAGCRAFVLADDGTDADVGGSGVNVFAQGY